MSAHSRFLSKFAVAAAAALAFSSCIITTTPTGLNGDITFTWTFAGRRCFEVPEVARVVVQIPGQVLQNEGVFDCTTGGTAGIRLLNFRPGTYSYTLSGQTASGTVLYQASGKVVVDGNVSAQVDLQPVAAATGSVYITWTLPVGTNVTCQYIEAVDISIDNGPRQAVTCASGGTSPGVLLQNLTVGRHTIDLSARDRDGLYYYRAINSFDVYAGGASAQQFTLEWIVGSIPIRWTFSNGTTQVNCAQAGVSQISITLRNDQGKDQSFAANCLNNGVQGAQVPYVYYGRYQIFLSATGTGGAVYRSNTSNPPVFTVVAGSFPDVDGSTPTILMTP